MAFRKDSLKQARAGLIQLLIALNSKATTVYGAVGMRIAHAHTMQ